MKITNKLNLPSSFINYINKDAKEHVIENNKFSVTELLKPIREIILYRKYYDQLETDASDIVPALFGSAVHHILESNTEASDTLLPEESIKCELNGITLSGRIDLLNLRDLSIEDYKTCSVSKISKNDFEDWKMQGLIYAYMVFKTRDIIIRKLRFYALMKDWSKVRSLSTSSYPVNPIYVYEYDIKDSDFDYIEKWLNDKLKSIKFCIETNQLPTCSDEEKWFTGDKYAVYKNKGDKRAAAVLDSEEEAHDYINNKLNNSGEIEVRKGECLKCKHYCPCKMFCGID